ncbi:MAG: hypothetical protein ACJ72Z_12145 [Pyrinomonadaceae bacterium]
MPPSPRDSILKFDEKFGRLHRSSVSIIASTDDRALYAEPSIQDNSMMTFSVGTSVIRSAGIVEQMIGGITTRLWDDPFEWTLPERLPGKSNVIVYLKEVEERRAHGFDYFRIDSDLDKMIPSPIEMRSLFDILLETLITAERFYGNAEALFKIIGSAEKRR